MLCLDIDGTLLNSQHKITQNTKKAIQKTREQNNTSVILVSARMPKGILFLQRELNITQPIICYSGALILDENLNRIFNRSIETPLLKKIYLSAQEINIHMSIYKENEWYVEQLDSWAAQESEITKISPSITEFNSLFYTWEGERDGANKVLCMGKAEEINELETNIKKSLDQYLNIYKSKPTYLEIMPKEASKTEAIKFLSQIQNIPSTEIMAMGDNYNDIDMIQYAGLGIAMGNAPQEVKICADTIAATNDEDGVAKAVYKYILSSEI